MCVLFLFFLVHTTIRTFYGIASVNVIKLDDQIGERWPLNLDQSLHVYHGHNSVIGMGGGNQALQWLMK